MPDNNHLLTPTSKRPFATTADRYNDAGAWRTGPAWVVSGHVGRERVHFEGPEPERVPGEMSAFLEWFNSTPETDGVIRAATAHLWFAAMHPFEDGNGRIARAITDMALARSQSSPMRLYSVSHRILRERDAYYHALENATLETTGTCDITAWLSWFAGCLGRAMDDALEALSAAQQNAALETRPETPCREEGFSQGGRREQSEGPNLPEPRGPGIGGGVDDTGNQGAAGPGTGGGFSRRAGFGGHQGQVGHRGGQVQLEPGFDAAEVAGLADSQLDQPCQPVLHHHAALPILSKTLAVLQCADLLQ